MDIFSASFQILEHMVLEPSVTGVVGLFLASTINELLTNVPFALILSSQLLFLDGSVTLAFATKFFIFIAIPVGLGATVGSLPVYALAYFGGKPAIDKFGKYFKLSWTHIEKVQNKFKGAWYDEVIFLAIRIAPLLPSIPFTAAAGILRMPIWKYLLFTLIGFTIRMMVMFALILIGIESLSF